MGWGRGGPDHDPSGMYLYTVGEDIFTGNKTSRICDLKYFHVNSFSMILK